MNKFYKLIIITFCFASFAADAKSPPPGSGAADVPANILLMLDTSGSMGSILPGGDTENPRDLAFDSEGNIYVAKYFDQVEKYDSSGNYVKTWGAYNGTSQNGFFDYTYSIATDSSDNVYVSDYLHGRVQKFDNDGNHLMNFNLTSSGVARGVEVDSSGNVYIVNGNGDVEKFNSLGTKIQEWNTNNAYFIAEDRNTGDFYITRYYSNNIRKYDSNGTLLSTISLSWNPYGIDVDSNGDLYVTRLTNERTYKLSSTGTQLAVYGSGWGSSLGYFRNPRGVQVRPSDNKAFIADYDNDRIQSTDYQLLTTDGETKTRLEAAVDVIQQIVSDSNLTSGANFGLMTWNSNAQMRVNISDSSASEIYTTVESLTDGGATYLDNAMSLAETYFTGSNTPMNDNAPCQQNILIVISDGFWVDNTASATAESLYNSLGIKTFTIGFTTTGNGNYVTLSQKGGTYPDSPLYAENESALLDVLANYIRQIISTQLTFSVPTIIPGIANSDHILQSTFLYKTSHQWKGHLYKYSLATDGGIGSLIWDAAERLNQKTAGSRNIWTVAHALTHSINNFTTTNVDRLKPALENNLSSGYSEEEIEDLINFTRGTDVYNEFGGADVDDDGDTIIAGERWKLADIYHSKAVAVAKPSAFFSDEANENSESYYRAINGYKQFRDGSACGGNCASREEIIYVGSNSGMLHAFESDSGDEKWAFIPPFVLPYLRDVISSNANESISIYGVDGSPIVKDIYVDGAWKTILLAGARQGASGYFALDITDPDNPKHLFSFANNKITGEVSYWDENNIRTDYNISSTVPDFDYSKLGESWSDPLILNIPVSGQKKWVAVFGGGYNNNVSTGYANVIYIIDLENDGKVLEIIDIPDYSGSNGIANSVPVRLTAVTTDTTKKFFDAGALVYFTDLEGILWKINLTDKGTLYETTRLFNAESTDENDRMCFNQVESTILENGDLAHFFGTADMSRIGSVSDAIQNKVYSVIDENFPDFFDIGTPYTESFLQDVTSGSVCPTSTQKGFYIDMDSNEKVTASITIHNSSIIVPRYTPSTTNLCTSGTSKISEHDFLCGSTSRETNLGEGMATEPIVYKNKLYIGISSDAALDAGTLPAGFVKQGNLIIGDPVSITIPTVRVEYWKEN